MPEESTVLTPGTDNTPPADGTPQEPTYFINKLPETIRGHEALAPFKESTDLSELAQGYIDAKGELAKVPVRPESPDGYSLEGVEEQPNDERYKAFKELAHKIGLHQGQFNALYQAGMENTTTAVKQMQEGIQAKIKERKEQGISELKDEWGAKYDENLEIAKHVITRIGDEKFVKWLNDSGIGDNPQLARFFHKLGGMISEGSFHDGQTVIPQKRKTTDAGVPYLDFPNTPNMRGA